MIAELVELEDERADVVDVALLPELAYLIAAARDAAWQSHCNVIGVRYHERKDALARLRGALSAYDRARGAV